MDSSFSHAKYFVTPNGDAKHRWGRSNWRVSFTSPVGAVAKYCDEYVCVCVSVCLSVGVSVRLRGCTTRAIFTNSSVHVTYSRGLVLLRQGDAIPRERNNFGGFLPTNNALYSVAFGTHTKKAEPIEMPFGMMTWIGSKYMC